ncbi:hypothetical protein DFH27DRAFT_276175 [Peziza echinospora]|nr:hypothetical protein DFH27DRAFT_276175 [Peziza echinospora]
MLFEEGDATLLKKWIVKRLEDISDADSDVLADYVLALLRHEQGEAEVKKLCVDQLDDFLREHTVGFVDDVFVALRNKSFLSVNSTLSGSTVVLPPPPQPSPPPQQQQQRQQSPTPEVSTPAQKTATEEQVGGEVEQARGVQSPTQQSGNGHQLAGEDRGRGGAMDRGQKRSYHDRDRDGGRDPQYGPNSTSTRGFKAPRRGGERGGVGRWAGRGDIGAGRGVGGGQQQQQQPPFPTQFPAAPLGVPPPPIMPPGFPWPDETMATLLAMQAAAAWPGMPPFPAIPTVPSAAPQRAGQSPAVIPGVDAAAAQRKPVERKVGERCKDYDEKGYCMQGDMCPYEHGMDHIVIAGQEATLDEYDPNNSQLFSVPTASSTPGANGSSDSRRGGGFNDRGRGRGRGRGGAAGRGGRSDMSHTGPNFDKSNTTLVVEHIPDDKLDESSIKEFFSAFGSVSEVGLQPYKKLATVKFERWDMAKKAYDSPAPIFDNRFVKVFWYKNEGSAAGGAGRGGHHHPGHGAPGAARSGSPPAQLSKLADEGEIDMEEFKRKSEEAQKSYEAKVARKKAHEEAMKELEKKKEELLKMEQEQKRILMEKLAKRKGAAKLVANGASTPPTPNNTPATPAVGAEGAEKVATPAAAAAAGAAATTQSDAETEALRAQLEALEAEAKSLGIEHPASEEAHAHHHPHSTYRGRGIASRGRVFRGASRGTYTSPYIPPTAGKPYAIPGAYRGRGGAGAPRGGAMRLDNRTKKVSVGGVDVSGERNEALRQYLLAVGEFEGIEPHPEKEGVQVVTFKDRMTAEKFVHGGSYIPNIGKVELGWVNTPLPPVKSVANSSSSNAANADSSSNDVEAKNGGAAASTAANTASTTTTTTATQQAVEDYDLADDDEARWLAE